MDLYFPEEFWRAGVLEMPEDSLAIKRVSLVDQAEQRLRSRIGGKGFQYGDTLPRENELMVMLGVSRTVVREAVSRLRMLGMLECRRRGGTVIVSPDLAANLNRMFHPMLLNARSAREIMEIRLSLEIGMAEFVFERKTSDDLRELRDIHAHRTKNSSHLEDFLIVEARFHGKLFAIAKNPLLSGFYELMPRFYQATSDLLGIPVKGNDSDDDPSGWLGHQNLIDILENGTSDQFRACMYDHLAPYVAALARMDGAKQGKAS